MVTTKPIDFRERAGEMEGALRFIQASINHSAMQDNKMITHEFAKTISGYIDVILRTP